MIDAIKTFFVDILGKEFAVFVCSMLPIIELRGGVPMGAALGLDWWLTYILAVLGNMVPVPMILFCVRGFIEWCGRSKVKFFNKLGAFLLRKAEKARPKIEKYAFWGITLFVALPLPMTGAWTGTLVCAIVREKPWKALLAAFIGVLIAATIMTLASYGVVAAFSIFA